MTGLGEGALIRLDNLLYGVQPRSTRQAVIVPSPWADTMIGPVVTDSREVTPGSLFVALAGEDRIVFDQDLSYVEEESARHRRKGADD